MKKEWLKDNLKERFDELDSGLDLEQAWTDLNNRRKPRKKDRRFIIFWIGLAFLGITIASSYLLTSPSEIRKIDLHGQEKIAKFESLNENVNEFVIQKEGETNASIERTTVDLDESKSLKLSKNNLNSKDNSNINLSSRPLRIIGQPNKDLKKNEQVSNTALTSNNIDPSESSTQIIYSTNTNDSDENHIRSELGIELISTLPTLMNQSINGKERAKITMNTIPMNLHKGQIPIVSNSRNSIGISFAYGWHNRQFDILGGDNLGFVTSKNNQEKALDVYEASLFYRKNFSNDFFAEVGLGLQQTTYEFKDQKTTIEKQRLDDQVIAIHNYPDGSKESILGTFEQTETRIRNNTFYQKFRQIHMNLIVGKEFGLSHFFGLNISGGLEYGLFSQNKGVSFSNTIDLRDYWELSELDYKKNGMLSGLFRVELLTALDGRNELGFALIGKSSLSNLFAKNEFSEKRKYLMSRVSYSYRF